MITAELVKVTVSDDDWEEPIILHIRFQGLGIIMQPMSLKEFCQSLNSHLLIRPIEIVAEIRMKGDGR